MGKMLLKSLPINKEGSYFMINSFPLFGVPKEKHKVFVSYYHRDDQFYKATFDYIFNNTFINKSVAQGEINTDISTEYIKRLIREDFISDASVIIVLIGPNTYGRKHIDWEISASLDKKVNGRSGLFGLILPEHEAYGQKQYRPDSIPARLHDNVKAGYAKIYQWTTDSNIIKQCVEIAFNDRVNLCASADNSRVQMKYNRGENGFIENLLRPKF
jgi:hypothetical protein